MNYSKKTKNKDLFKQKAVVKSPSELETLEAHLPINTTVGYSKGEGFLTISKFFLLVEGEVKEPKYIIDLVNTPAFRNLIVAYRSPANETGGNLVNKMVQIITKATTENKIADGEGKIHQLDSIDKIFVIIDVDALENELANALKLDLSAQWIISNPCFEIWLYYAYNSTPEELKLDVIQNPVARSQELKRLLPTTHKGGINARKAFAEIYTAIKNSKAHYQLQSNMVPTLYSTQMHIFAEEVLLVLKESYDKWLAERRRKLSEFVGNMK